MMGPDDRDLRFPGEPATEVEPAPGRGSAGPQRAVGTVLGGRYELRGMLGRGGMGEVWLARDLKLQVEVALKALAPQVLGDEAALARLRAEVRSARAVSSPHVCRVYDLIEAGGLELVSMEYVDGTTLRQVLDSRSPLELSAARDIALQLLSGLRAIHEAGLVHRDVKPANVMITRAGRVVLMDFGIAKQVATGGTVAGTPAYWAPEQAAGSAADPRADLFAAGIVLAEMVAPSGARDRAQQQALWQALREDPPRAPEGPWSAAIARAVARAPARRYPSAQALAQALEEVAHRVTGIEEAQPYPGLSSFTEAEAEYFFGREVEVEGMWRRLPQRHLLGLVGPSGAGKSSFLRAGVIPAKPEGWAHLICTPGNAPFVALGQALVPEVSRDTDAMRKMLRFEDSDVAVELFRRWRRDHSEALVIVDQLEELFTLNPPEIQARFATLLSRLALEADVHVLLAMRDDFLLRCQEHEVLRPVFEGLAPLGPPAGDALRRALVQPALKCGYRFEDEALVADMLHAVEGERGALPLLAFAAASLWERRDREHGLLTRAAHDVIGGVAGALAQHAEATLERIGAEREPIVRELFRNLVTAQGTRAVCDVDELITVFPEGQRTDAGVVLKSLVDARLLTGYEAHATEPGQTAGRRVEVVHESLLASWPRLVRWQAQDEEGALLRDQLRQAAHLWEERGKPDDLLWTGTSYQEYQVWRSRYPGGLSESEETFGRAMVEQAGRRRRRRRQAVAAAMVVLLAVAAALSLMWRRSVLQTRRAEAEAAQREAAQLLALGRLELASQPNASLAYAIASLERADNDPARRFALEVLAQGPPALFLSDPVNAWSAAWSPDGRRLALGGNQGLVVFERGTEQRLQLSSSLERTKGFTSDGRRLVTQAADGAPTALHVWALPEGRLERTLGDAEAWGATLVGDHLLSLSDRADGSVLVRHLSLDGASPELVGRLDLRGVTAWSLEPTLTQLLTIQGGRLVQQRLDDLASPGRVIGTHENAHDVVAWNWRDQAVTFDVSDNGPSELRLWDLPAARIERIVKSPVVPEKIDLDPGGSFLATGAARLFLFDLAAPATAEPVPLLFEDHLGGVHFSPDGSWLASVHNGTVILWSMAGPRPIVLGRREEGYWESVAFTPDGDLLAASSDGAIGRWSLSPADGSEPRVLWPRPGAGIEAFLELDSAGRIAVVTERFAGVVIVVPLDGSEASTYRLKRPPGAAMFGGWPSLDPSGRYLAVCALAWGNPEANGIRILDLDTGDERTLDTHPEGGNGCEVPGSGNEGIAVPLWLPDGRLITDGDAGLRLWDLDSGGSRLLRGCRESHPSSVIHLLATPDSRTILRLKGVVRVEDTSSLLAFDLASGEEREISSHGNRLVKLALDPSGTILLTVDWDGTVRVGPLTGEEPHLLFGHNPGDVAVSPDGRWIAATVDDPAIRLWRMPDLSKPPLHTLPYDELLAKLKSLTNLRAVRDPVSDTGWKIEIGPFPGWAIVPEWQP